MSRLPQAQQMATARPVSARASPPAAHQLPEASTATSTGLRQLRIAECRPHSMGLSTDV